LRYKEKVEIDPEEKRQEARDAMEHCAYLKKHLETVNASQRAQAEAEYAAAYQEYMQLSKWL